MDDESEDPMLYFKRQKEEGSGEYIPSLEADTLEDFDKSDGGTLLKTFWFRRIVANAQEAVEKIGEFSEPREPSYISRLRWYREKYGDRTEE